MTVDEMAIDVLVRTDGTTRDWRAASVCRKHPTKWWFAGTHQDTLLAKAICSGCGVQASCLEFALSRPDLLGIWAGTTPSDRAAIRRGDLAPERAAAAVTDAGALLDADNGVDFERGAAVRADVVRADVVQVDVVEIDVIASTEPEPVAASESKGNSRRGPRRGIGRDPVAGSGNSELLTPAEAARKLGVTPNTVTRWSRAGKISAIQTMGGHRRFRMAEIERVQREANLAPAAPFPA